MRALVVCFSYLLLAPLPAFAEAVVTWTAAEECPVAAQSRAEVVRLLGTPLGKIELQLSATVRLQRASAHEFEATISIRSGGQTRERTLRDTSCAVLAHAAAVVVALAIDPATMLPEASAEPPLGAPVGARRGSSRRASSRERAAARAPKPAPVEPAPAPVEPAPAAAPVEPAAAPAEPAPVEAASAPAPPVSPASAPNSEAPARSSSVRAESTISIPSAGARGRQRRGERAPKHESPPAPTYEERSRRTGPLATQAVVGAGAALVAYVIPGVAPAITAHVGMLRRRFWAALRLLHAPAQRALLELPMGVGGRVALWAMALESGARVRWSVLELPLFVGVEAGRLSARGVGVADSWLEHRPWLAASLGSGLTYVWRERFAIGARVDGTAALLRPRFGVRRISGEEYVFHRVERIALRGYFTIEVRLPWW